MRRRILTWIAALAVMAVAATVGVVVLNQTAFGAAGFVRVYLEALARHDVDGALAMPGVTADGADETLLDAAMLDELEVVEVAEQGEADGVHEVLATWRTPAGTGSTVFHVERIGSRAVFFPEWAFATSPLATLTLMLTNEDRFRVNGVDVRADRIRTAPHEFAVLVPGSYRLEHVSRYLVGDPVDVVAAEPAGRVPATVEVRANATLVDAIDSASRARLERCTTQQVLFPTGCPFGKSIPDRVLSAPVWSIVQHPEIVVAPSGGGEWAVEPTPALAYLVVDVQSIFDGSVSTIEEDVAFTVSYALDFGPGDQLTITPTDLG